ncbi:MAG: hypothetical protein RI935_668 [Candidatus Parcubacteria bacterium]|jgi:UPF0755 protein
MREFLRERHFLHLIVAVACIGFIFFILQSFLFKTNSTKTFVINEGESLRSLSLRLEEENIIASAFLLRAILSFNNKDTKVQLGEYSFDESENLFSVIHKITEEGPNNPLLRVTVPEGSSDEEIFQFFAKKLPDLSKSTFFEIIEKRNAHGKLFPSTYHILPSYKEDEVIQIMLDVYIKEATPVIGESIKNGYILSEYEILTLASILEGEANNEKDMKIVAGILLERMRIGMPLQVDVAMETYKRRGLPIKPINNPGLIAIQATLNPISTDYLYYITGNDGAMYYAKTFNEHKRNIQKHLR